MLTVLFDKLREEGGGVGGGGELKGFGRQKKKKKKKKKKPRVYIDSVRWSSKVPISGVFTPVLTPTTPEKTLHF